MAKWSPTGCGSTTCAEQGWLGWTQATGMYFGTGLKRIAVICERPAMNGRAGVNLERKGRAKDGMHKISWPLMLLWTNTAMLVPQ